MRHLFFMVFIWTLAVGAAAETTNDAIKAYNSAKTSSDVEARIAAAQNLGESAIMDRDRSDTLTLVFEATQSLALNGAVDKASAFADWLEGAPVTEQGAIRPEDVSLLVSFVRWSDKSNNRNRKDLDVALGRIQLKEPSLLSLIAFRDRYISDMNRGRWNLATQNALATATHLESVKNSVFENWSLAKIHGYSSQFNHSQGADALFNMARHQAELETLHHKWHKISDDHPEWINQHMNSAKAWTLAIDAYLDSNSSERGKKAQMRSAELSEILDWSSRLEPTQDTSAVSVEEEGENNDDATRLPFCKGAFNMVPELKYPRRAQRRGLVGAIILSIDVQDGAVTKVESLAAVPDEGFVDDTIEIVKQWTWEKDAEKNSLPCTMDAEGISWPFTFTFERL